MLSSLLALCLLTAVKADIHQLIVGTFGTEKLSTLEFDDVALTLNLIGNYTANAASSWIATSYTTPPLHLEEIALRLKPYSSSPLQSLLTLFYGTPFGSNAECGAVISADENDVLSELIQNYSYKCTSGVHGVALDSTNPFLYSADDSANTLWTHQMDNTTGDYTLVSSISGPVTGADPRHVAVRPEGHYLYVILEDANEVAQYTIDQATVIPSFENVTYPLIPTDSSNSDYWSDEVDLSLSNTYLWATSQARTTTYTGYISALKSRF